MIRPLLDEGGIAALREALLSANYTSRGIAERIGAAAVNAINAGDRRTALRATTEGDPLDTLIRLFVCGQTEPAHRVAAALAPLPLDTACRAGLVVADHDGLRQGIDLEAYGDSWWVVSDVPASARPGQALPANHVLGVGAASSTLADATPRRPVGTALDVGTGCGVQALHLSTHADQVTATDVNERALRFAATTAALNGLRWELLAGDLAAPVAGRRFDLVVSNPPFVVGPGTATHAYRDSGRPSDRVCAELVAAAPSLLAPGGTMQFLANWLHVAGEDWAERVAGWLAGTGLDAWVIQREVADPVAYVNLWLADAGETGDPQRVERWLDWFDAQRVQGVGFGLITLRAAGHTPPVVRIEDLRQQVARPFGDQVAAWFDRQNWLYGRDLLAARYRAASGIRLHQEATLGSDGWQVARQVLALADGLRWSQEVEPVTLALVAGADGTVPLASQLTLLARAYQIPEEELRDVAIPLVARLVERGFLQPVPDDDGLDQPDHPAAGLRVACDPAGTVTAD